MLFSYFFIDVQVLEHSDYSEYFTLPPIIEQIPSARKSNAIYTPFVVTTLLKSKTTQGGAVLLEPTNSIDEITGDSPSVTPAPEPSLIQPPSDGLLQEAPASEVQQSIDLPNALHLFEWYHFCDGSLPQILSWPLFPNFPFSHKTTTLAFVTKFDINSIYRVFGYLIPPLDGSYIFAVDIQTPVQFWISKDDLPANLSLVPLLQLRSNILSSDLYSSFLNNENMVELGRNKYFYVEFFFALKQSLIGSLSLKWLIPGEKEFQNIDKAFMGATSEQAIQSSPSPTPPYPPFRLPNIVVDANFAKRISFITLPHLSLKELDQLYTVCDYSPSFAIIQSIARYRGVEMVGPMVLSVFPDDGSNFRGASRERNELIPQQEANSILESHIKTMKEKWSEIKSIFLVNLEVQRDPSKGNRFLIETEVALKDSVKYRFSQFLFSPIDNPISYCQPRGVRYKGNTFVHIALSLKNQGHFFQYFIENVERIYRETKDENFGIIVVDFDSTDIDVEQVVKRSLIPYKKFVRMEGKYERASSLNMALSKVDNENDIVFTCDLHLELPNDIVDSIRKHSFQGLSGYAPIVFRLECGHTILNPSGFWEGVGYGLFSMYKSDWVKVGSFNSANYKDKWGGEDWELVDRFLSKGYFMDRMKHSQLLHFFHDRSKLW